MYIGQTDLNIYLYIAIKMDSCLVYALCISIPIDGPTTTKFGIIIITEFVQAWLLEKLKTDKLCFYCRAFKFKKETPDKCCVGGNVKLAELNTISIARPITTKLSGTEIY